MKRFPADLESGLLSQGIYTPVIKVIYFLDSGNCCVDSERRWHLFGLVQAKCDSKRLKITQIFDQGKHFTCNSQAACRRVVHKDCFPFSKYTRWLDILSTFAIPRSFAMSAKCAAFTGCRVPYIQWMVANIAEKNQELETSRHERWEQKLAKEIRKQQKIFYHIPRLCKKRRAM